MKKILLFFVISLTAAFVSAEDNNTLYCGKPVKYVFLFIGDGMGCHQRQLPETAAGKKLLINQLPVHGMTRTASANDAVTDSAAAGTALACGVKTNNGVVGMNAKGEQVDSIAVQAQKQGMKVGIISSVPLNHATPAAFYAHCDSRGDYDAIAMMMADSGFDFFGGCTLITSDSDKIKNNMKKTGQDTSVDPVKASKILSLMNDKGYKVVAFPTDLSTVDASGKTFIYRDMTNVIDETPANGFNLPQLTAKAIKALENPKGFFIMVEGGRIDWACHANDGAAAIAEVIAFDDAVSEAYKFYQQHPDDTLIVVTADHETGGLTVVNAEKSVKLMHEKQSFDKLKAAAAALKRQFVPVSHGIEWKAGNSHSAADVKTTAVGQGAEIFSGNYENTALNTKIRSCLAPAN